MLKQSYTFQSPIGILTISEADGYLTNLFLETENVILLSEKQSEHRYHLHSDCFYMKRTARFRNISRESEGILQFQSRQKGQRFRSEYGKSYAKSHMGKRGVMQRLQQV